MSKYDLVYTPWGYQELDTDESSIAFKQAMGRVHTSSGREWSSESLTCSFKMAPLRIMSSSVPPTPPTTYTGATANRMIIHTGTFQAAVGPQGGRIYCVYDAADTTGKTWVAVHSGTIATLAAQARPFNSTGSDKDFILTDFIAPWHVTGSANAYDSYQVRVYACTGSGNPPQSISEVSASNVLGWVFYYDAGVLKFTNPTLTFPFTSFVTFENNLDSLSDYTNWGFDIITDTRTTTEHTVVMAGTWLSGSVKHKLYDMVTNARSVCTTGSCFAIDTYRYTGGYCDHLSQL